MGIYDGYLFSTSFSGAQNSSILLHPLQLSHLNPGSVKRKKIWRRIFAFKIHGLKKTHITFTYIPYDTHASAKPICKGGWDIWSSWVPKKEEINLGEKLTVFATSFQSTKDNKSTPSL